MRKLKKIPIQIYLEPEQQKIIDILSKTRGKSKAAIIRSCISEYITTLSPREDPALNIMNLGTSGKKDIAQKHDEYLISHKK